MPTYDFKFTPEFLWFVLTTTVAAVAQFIVTSQQPTDLQPWLIALATAAVRALVGALIAASTKGTRGFAA